MPSESNAAPIWVLLGAKHGDNQQLLAMATALKLPFRTVQLHFNSTATLAPVVLGASGLSWRSDAPLAAPWPRLVLSAGRKSVPAARWIRHQSGGRTRLVHVNRPWAPLSWFDLIVSTPQYAVPARPNVVANLMPFLPPLPAESSPASWPSRAVGLPRPWTVVLVGGNSRPHVLSEVAAAALASAVNARVREVGGSAWVLDSPRTPPAAMAIIETSLEVSACVSLWRDGEKLYRPLLGLADHFIVTADSASMLTEALLTGRPVTPFELPVQPDWRWRVASAWRHAAERAPASLIARSFDAAVDLGLLSSVRDLSLLHRALTQAGVFSETGRASGIAAQERQVTLARMAALIDAP